MTIKFVKEVPSAKRGRPADPKVAETVAALAQRPGEWAQIESGLDSPTANKVGGSLKRAGAESSVRRDDNNTYSVYARFTK